MARASRTRSFLRSISALTPDIAIGSIAFGIGMTAKEFKRRREQLGLTQAQLAEAMGVVWNTVARWESGLRRVPAMATILLGYLERDRRFISKSRKWR